jgi:hypothetical protein
MSVCFSKTQYDPNVPEFSPKIKHNLDPTEWVKKNKNSQEILPKVEYNLDAPEFVPRNALKPKSQKDYNNKEIQSVSQN